MKKIELKEITISGYKSIKSLQNFKPNAINVFIGQNGAGKSNFISFFKFLANLLSGQGNLGIYTGIQGGASELIFDGNIDLPISASLTFQSETGINEYYFKLTHASGDSFIFYEEKFRNVDNNTAKSIEWKSKNIGQKESALISTLIVTAIDQLLIEIKKNLQKIVVYQFHNTTYGSPIRSIKTDIENGWFMEEDGRNLAAVLFNLSNNEPAIYYKIINILTQILPFFLDFVLYNEYGKIFLRWRERESTKTFVATHASDGMLRAMALVTLLCLPPDRLPGIIFIDEPELGLHPTAISIICSLIQGVSEYCQIFIATQNAELLNEFDISDVIVVEREGRESKFKRLNESDFSEWLNDYSLSQLWKQNIIGGKP